MMKENSYKEMGCRLCDPKKQILLGVSEHWVWIADIAPYWKYHTMFVSKKHIEDITEISTEQFTDLRSFYLKVKNHLLSLKLRYENGKLVDQFILMLRLRENNMPDGSTYPKPQHLHIHFIPDHEGVARFKIDETAKDIDIESIAL